MSFSSAKRRRIKPYARPTSFDYNVRFDIRQYQDVKYNRVKNPTFASASNDECFRVMEGELLVKNCAAGCRYNDKELHVFSFANGLSVDPAAPMGTEFKDGDEVNNTLRTRGLILSQLQYMGVAVTEFSPARDVYEQGFVATIAGLNTLYNNSNNTIYPGQTLCLDLPKVRGGNSGRHKRALQTGVPREKLQFVVRPKDEMLVDYNDEALVNKFIIGTAISYSRPGDTVDVILHRINYTSVDAGAMGGAGGDRFGDEEFEIPAAFKMFSKGAQKNLKKTFNKIATNLQGLGDMGLVKHFASANSLEDLRKVQSAIKDTSSDAYVGLNAVITSAERAEAHLTGMVDAVSTRTPSISAAVGSKKKKGKK